jgi:hypothetical protein
MRECERTGRSKRRLAHDAGPIEGGKVGCLNYITTSIRSARRRCAPRFLKRGQDVGEHLLGLQGDQNHPEYLKLNPNGVVPPWFTTIT